MDPSSFVVFSKIARNKEEPQGRISANFDIEVRVFSTKNFFVVTEFFAVVRSSHAYYVRGGIPFFGKNFAILHFEIIHSKTMNMGIEQFEIFFIVIQYFGALFPVIYRGHGHTFWFLMRFWIKFWQFYENKCCEFTELEILNHKLLGRKFKFLKLLILWKKWKFIKLKKPTNSKKMWKILQNSQINITTSTFRDFPAVFKASD